MECAVRNSPPEFQVSLLGEEPRRFWGQGALEGQGDLVLLFVSQVHFDFLYGTVCLEHDE